MSNYYITYQKKGAVRFLSVLSLIFAIAYTPGFFIEFTKVTVGYFEDKPMNVTNGYQFVFSPVRCAEAVLWVLSFFLCALYFLFLFNKGKARAIPAISCILYVSMRAIYLVSSADINVIDTGAICALAIAIAMLFGNSSSLKKALPILCYINIFFSVLFCVASEISKTKSGWSIFYLADSRVSRDCIIISFITNVLFCVAISLFSLTIAVFSTNNGAPAIFRKFRKSVADKNLSPEIRFKMLKQQLDCGELTVDEYKAARETVLNSL